MITSKIHKIEDEFGESIQETIKDLCFRPNYMGYTFDLRELAGILEIDRRTIRGYAKRLNIRLPDFVHTHPSSIDDICWVKYGLTLKQYFKTRHQWMSIREMSIELGCHPDTIRDFLKEYGYKDKQIFGDYKWGR
jgi:hypothetical protein